MERKPYISTLWVQDLDSEEKQKFIDYLKNQYENSVLIKLKKIVREKRESLEATERSPEIYGNAAWPYKQAHNNGARQMLKMVEDLLSFTKG